MASRTTLNAANLEALGAVRLAALLIEISTGDANAKRRLRLELAHEASPQSAAHEIRKRLTAIANAKSRVGWRKRKNLVKDLEGQRHAIVDKLGASDPAEALDLLWRYLALANGIFERTEDGSGTVMAEFGKAVDDLVTLAARLGPPPDALAGQVFAALTENEHGQFDDLIEKLAPVLGSKGQAALKSKIIDWANEPVDREPDEDRRIVAYSLDGPMYEDEFQSFSKRHRSDTALRAIADAKGDVNDFVAHHSEMERRVPSVAAEIAARLSAAGRPKEALEALVAVLETPEEIVTDFIEPEWEAAYVAALEASGRSDEAQAFRWLCFEKRLDVPMLKAYIARLPDFEDVETEAKVLASVGEREDPHDALGFFVEWPDLKRAADLVVDPERAWNGDLYYLLTPASERLAPSHPLASTRLLRAMIDFTLDEGKSSRYKHAARHLGECERLAAEIAEFGFMEDHAAYAARLRQGHGRKRGFWNRVKD
ncbi:hypothetical protein FP2506_01768 [Fulvimarina pelagi HTCC2506]|uniref:Uncharacterized protein n=1 Tax=Fulvimarina pelagi HTCC2506 TaxID=314231 RepID=Q0FXI1_9HYPH|nr:DUF6880 family protein [Fulvimarina pelagi]EAU39669.1 hypothetical protein FP2506_01768 [Fulvimarina pelagi HTCC2506]